MGKHTPVLLLTFLTSCIDPRAARPVISPAQSHSASTYADSPQQGAQPGLSPTATGVSYTTIAEVLRRPILFQGQLIRLKGRVGDGQPPRPPVAPAARVFTLVDHAGNAVTVETVDRAAVRVGQELTVEGTLSVADGGTSSTVAVLITEARIIPSARKGRQDSPATTVPARRGSPPHPAAPAQKDSAGEGRIF